MEVPMIFQKKLPQECPQKDCGGISKGIKKTICRDWRNSEAISEGFLKGIIEGMPKKTLHNMPKEFLKLFPDELLKSKSQKIFKDILAIEIFKVIAYDILKGNLK